VKALRDNLKFTTGGEMLDISSTQPQPGGRTRGLFDPKTKDYRALDVVAFNGSEWRARYDNPGPLPGDGWVLGAKGVRGGQASAGFLVSRSPRSTWSVIRWW
jgi:hypothetical protein